MSAYEITLVLLSTNELPSLQPLVDEFVATYRSLPFKESYWDSFQQWLLKKRGDPDILVLAAHVDGKLAGFGLGTTQETGPLMVPERIGYVSLLVVAPQFRNVGVGKALCNGMCDWFLSNGIREVELYTEVGNELSNRFWDRRGFQPLLVRRRRNIGRASTPP
jgi:ribosomal protein S18 acetylase RimI-like enzyme